jgi:recombination protein RecA
MSLIIKDNPSLIAGTAQPTVKPKVDKLPAKLPSLTKAEKLDAIKSVTKSMNAEYECTLLQKLGTQSKLRLPCIVTGMPTFDETLMSCGGLPDGRVVEVYGPESSGKTTWALHVIAMAQRQGDFAAFVDAEHALDPNYAKKLGVDVDELLISQPDYGEQALEVVEALVDTRSFRVIVIDSVSALVPRAEIDGEMGDSHMGLQARLMSQAMRKLVGKAYKSGTTLIFINQVREKIGVTFGNPEVTTGGRALKFWSSVRLEVRRLSKTDGGEIKDDTGTHVGHRMRIKNAKNKVGPPFRETIVNLMYDSGFDLNADVVEYAIQTGIVTEPSKGWFEFEGERYRKQDLTKEPLFGSIKEAAYRAKDVKLSNPVHS